MGDGGGWGWNVPIVKKPIPSPRAKNQGPSEYFSIQIRKNKHLCQYFQHFQLFFKVALEPYLFPSLLFNII